jgi:hypothetical protein
MQMEPQINGIEGFIKQKLKIIRNFPDAADRFV